MTAEQHALWERIEAFNIDGDASPDLPFAARLARENSWALPFAERAVREYKRFVFLTMTVGQSMCPSEQVDQVWHLHLTYTRSYWQRFCGDVLKCPLHHEPTRGGAAEGQKHWAMYADTLIAYTDTFGEEPPANVWPAAEQRFGADLEVARVNPNEYWLVRKPRLRRPALAATAIVAAVLAIGCGNPFDEKGTDFLPYLFAAWIMAFILGLIVRKMSKGSATNPDDPPPPLGHYEAAYLSGGRNRVVAAALVALKEHGQADIATNGHVIIRNVPRDADPVENAVFGALAKQSGNALDLRPLTAAVKALESTRFEKLEEQGYVASSITRKLSSALPLLLCLGTLALVGLPRVVFGAQNNRPSGYLIVSMIVMLIVTLGAFGRGVRRTRKADDGIANLSKRHAGLRKLRGDAQLGDAPMAVAIFGAAVLTGTAYGVVYDRIRKYDSAGSGGGCSTTSSSGCSGGGGCGGGGGDGGGGGGCGGCGGGGGGD